MASAGLINSLAPDQEDDFSQPLLPDSAAKPKPAPTSAVGRLLDLTLAVLVPWLSFFSVLLIYLFLYRDAKILTQFVVAVLTSGCLVALCVGAASRNGLFLAVGWLALASVIAGALVGAYIHAEYLDYYYTVRRGQRLLQVNPSDAPTNTNGAGVLEFIRGTIVDDYRTLGFVHQGHIYCVAPILDQVQSEYPQLVNYWAAGVDCCERRKNFDCGASQDPNVLTAVVASPQESFEKALAEAKEVYNVSTPQDRQLLTFVHSVKQVQSGVWAEAINVLLVAAGVHLVISLFVAVALMEMMPHELGKPVSAYD